MKKNKSKIRKSIRISYIILGITLIFINLTSIYNKLSKQTDNSTTEEILDYTNKFNSSYIVKLKENSFIQQNNLPMGQVYITELIDSINMNLNYYYKASRVSNLTYTYSIIGILQADYTKEGVKQRVWEKEYIIKPETEGNSKNSLIEINESVDIDINKYNSEVYKFEKDLGMPLDAKLSIKLIVDVSSKFDNNLINSDYESDINIELGEKTTQITGKFEDEYSEKLNRNLETLDLSEKVSISINIIIIILAVLWLRHILLNTRNSNIVRNAFKLELNRILKSCEDKLVKVNKKVDVTGKEIIEVKDFGELIKLSEELFKPILYWNNSEKEEAEFFILIDNLIYRYELKVN